MNLYSYDGLVKGITSWTKRSVDDTTFVANIDIFISLAEQQIFNDLSVLGNQQYGTGKLIAGNQIVSKPALWGKTLTLSFLDQDGKNIEIISRAAYEKSLQFGNPITKTGKPQYYTDFGFNYFILTPVPDFAYDFQLAYYTKLPPLTVQNQTNWLTQNGYDLLFYCSLAKAYLFLNNPDYSSLYQQLYSDRVNAYTTYDMKRLVDRFTDIANTDVGEKK